VCKQARPVEATTIVNEIESSANECFLDLPKDCDPCLYKERKDRFKKEVLVVVGKHPRHNNNDILTELAHRKLFSILSIVRAILT
jgi:hypothetical protein